MDLRCVYTRLSWELRSCMWWYVEPSNTVLIRTIMFQYTSINRPEIHYEGFVYEAVSFDQRRDRCWGSRLRLCVRRRQHSLKCAKWSELEWCETHKYRFDFGSSDDEGLRCDQMEMRSDKRHRHRHSSTNEQTCRADNCLLVSIIWLLASSHTLI